METTAMDRTATLKVGDQAPDFTLSDQNGSKVTLSSFHGQKSVVLVFHPLAFTSVCTVQMPGYSKERQSFEGLDAPISGPTERSRRSMGFSAPRDIPNALRL